ncbi:MAG: Glu/Leu/Phe/Val dehydrogenase dimerization domain-containing protein, partial [Planctomycetota bacterium]
MTSRADDILARLREQDPEQHEFHQAVEETLPAVLDVLRRYPDLDQAGVIERALEPDRVIRFRVMWEDDEGNARIQRGWRVQQSSALGPYKGGLRFHRTLQLGTLRFLAFEQALKNALTGLPLGAGKGGSDFDPRGKSRDEVMRFCQAFMTALFRYIGPEVDVPAGDIGVGSREVDFLIGQYRRLDGRWNGALSGKSQPLGGIALRTEATGYGAVRFCERMLDSAGLDGLQGRRVAVTGSGNVALFAAERLVEKGARVVGMSDSGGALTAMDGLTRDELNAIKKLKLEDRGRLAAA